MKKAFYNQFPFEHTYDTEINGEPCTIFTKGSACVKVQPPDYSTWDSDYDYYGYTELSAYEVESVQILDTNAEVMQIPNIREIPDYKGYLNSLESYLEATGDYEYDY